MKAKRMLSAGLATLMALSMAACGSGTENEPETTAGADSSVQEVVDPLGKYPETVTLTSVVRSFTNMAVDPEHPEHDWENNHYSQLVMDELNINVDYKWIADFTQYDNKLATMLASNDMPDFMRVSNVLFTELAEADAIMDVTEMYEKYASDEMRRQMESFPDGFKSAFYNGKMYGIPMLGYGAISAPNIFWIRQDWLDKCGLEIPKTMDELHDTAKAFMEQCGAEYGIPLDKTGTNGGTCTLFPFMNAYHAYGKTWFEKDGKMVYGSVQPEMKDVLLEMQKWYKEGIIDPEFAVKGWEQAVEGVIAGKCGIMTGRSFMGINHLFSSVENDPSAEWVCMEIPAVDDEPIYYQGGWPAGEMVVISKDCEHPEAVLKMMNLSLEKWNDGTLLDMENTTKEDRAFYPVVQNVSTQDYNACPQIIEALETGDTSKMNPATLSQYETCLLWTEQKDLAGYGRYVQMTQAYPVLIKAADEGRILLDGLQGVIPKEYAKVKGTLDQMEEEMIVKVVMGEDISAFDEFVESWYKLGGEAAVEEVNERFQERQQNG